MYGAGDVRIENLLDAAIIEPNRCAMICSADGHQKNEPHLLPANGDRVFLDTFWCGVCNSGISDQLIFPQRFGVVANAGRLVDLFMCMGTTYAARLRASTTLSVRTLKIHRGASNSLQKYPAHGWHENSS